MGVFYAKRLVARVNQGFNSWVYSYFGQIGDNGLTPFAETVDAAGKIVIDRFLITLQAQSMADKSHMTRQANLMAEDMLQDNVTAANPLLGLLLDQYPTLRKRLAKKNASTIEALLPVVAKLFPGGPNIGGSSPGNGKAYDYVTKLKEG